MDINDDSLQASLDELSEDENNMNPSQESDQDSENEENYKIK